MADQLQLRRGTTAEIAVFTGAQGELVVDTDKNALVVQDGITAGGFYAATGAQVDDGTFYYNENVGSSANAYILDPKTNTNTPSSYMDGVQFGFVTTHPNTGPSTANFQGLGVKNLKYADGTDPQTGDISGRVYLIYDAVAGWLEIQRKATGAPPQLRTVTASVGSNQLTVGLQPGIFDFRSSSLGSGTINRRIVSTALSLIVPAGATLGTQNGLQSQIAILAIDNAGVVQIAVVNMASVINMDETDLINVTAITGGSNSANVVYSTSAASGVPYRVVGFVRSIQAVAGTWVTVPAEVQGQGGQANIGAAKMTLSAAQPTTSGTAIDFTGILPWVKRITMLFGGVSTNGTSNPIIQLGSGSVQITGYLSASALLAAPSTISVAGYTAGFGIPSALAANAVGGSVSFTRVDGNTWACSGNLVVTNATIAMSGSVTLSGALDRIRLTTVNGTDAFDAGLVNILMEG